MANVLTRRILTRRTIHVIKDYSNLSAFSCGNIITNKIYRRHYLPFQSGNLTFNALYKSHVSIGCYSSTENKYFDHGQDGDRSPKKMTLFQKFKQMYRDYWYVLVPVHLVTSAVWFGGFYYMAKSGFDIVAVLESWHVSERLTNPLRDSSMGYIAIAYALYKISTPARYTVTLGGTTITINYLKKWGYIKPVPSKERMKEIYEQRKSTLTKSMKETKEGIIEKKDTLIGTLQEKKEGIKEKKDNILQSVSKTRENLKKQKEGIKEKMSSIKEKS